MKLSNENIFYSAAQPNDATAIYEDLLHCGLQKWYASEDQGEGIHGNATFNTFEDAFRVLNKKQERVKFQHLWYSDWSWIESRSSDTTLFSAILENLNDDCIREIIEHIDLLHLLYIAHLNEQYKVFATEKLSKLHIFPFTVGSINLMNFRYLFGMFGTSMKEISVSLNAFTSHSGFYYSFTKRIIMQIIYSFTGSKLETVHLYDFNLTAMERENFDLILQSFSTRGVQINLI